MSAPSPYRLLPSVEEVLLRLGSRAELRSGGRERAAALVRALLDDWRAKIQRGELDAAAVAAALSAGELERAFEADVARANRRGIVRVINATGVVLNTGLGRACVHPQAAQAMREAAESYVVLEVDRESGERNERDAYLSEQLARLTGAEAAIAVNNNAAAVYLVLSTYAWGGREVVVSRGELVEIGGAFRVPEVMIRAGVALREVGTTNRTHAADYEQAIGERTGLLMKVHTSNYRVRGFVHEVGPAELAEIARRHGLPSAYDLGSGLIDPPRAQPLVGLGDEPRVVEAVRAGLDLVTFSGDKLLGAPQAGLIVGKARAVGLLRHNPIYRALRLDKVSLAGLEATFRLMLDGRGDELPVRRMLLEDIATIRARAEALARALRTLAASRAGLSVDVIEERSQPGSGSAPDVFLPTYCVRLGGIAGGEERLLERLRRGDPAVFARAQAGSVLLDPRTLNDSECAELARALAAALE